MCRCRCGRWCTRTRGRGRCWTTKQVGFGRCCDGEDHSWLLVEKHGYDPMCCPVTTHIYRSLFPRGQALHNIRSSPSVTGTVVGKIPSGTLFLGIQEESNREGVWIVLHRQTLHSFDIVSPTPCYLSAMLGESNRFVERLKCTLCFIQSIRTSPLQGLSVR